VPWIGSRITGAPDPPPPYTVELAFPHLKFDFPVVLAPAQGTDRLFVGDLRGRVFSFPGTRDCRRADLALDVAKIHPDLTAFYGLVCHPKFQQNRYVYVCYVLKNDLPDGSVVSRFEVSRPDPPVIDPKSERVILTFWSGGHNGGCLDFGKDGYLYISTGDGAGPSPPDTMMTGQDCTDLLSSVLRIDVDHDERGRPYRIPPDNPFLNLPDVRPEIWAFGFRNPWRMSIDRATGDLWVGDVGWELWEMVDKVQRGGNYGWSVVEGPQPVHVEGRRGPTPILAATKVHPHSEAASITGGYVYHGTRLSELSGAYIYGDYQTGLVWGLRCQDQTVTWQQELARTSIHLAAFGQSNDGEIFLIDHDRTHQIYRLVPNPAAKAGHAFPRRLSETGLFASTLAHHQAPGVIPYSVNSQLWSDGATAERFLALPGEGRIAVDEPGNWRFPEGSVLVRTVSVDVEPDNPATRRRVETQILHFEADAWRPYSYLWNDEQTDAALVDTQGTTATIGVLTDGGRREMNYRVHARAECVLCHNPWVEKKTTSFGVQSASPLAVNSPQLNKTSGSAGGAANQLETMYQIGLLSWVPQPSKLPRLVDPYDKTADLDQRARSYLQTNCSHCHQFNAGGSANIALGYDVPLEETKTVGVRPIQGTFNISGARIIAPGDPEGSVLYYRVSKLGGGRMPRAGSTRVDERATRLIHDWIAQMKGIKDGEPAAGGAHASPLERDAFKALQQADHLAPDTRLAAIQRLASSTRGALMLLGLVEDSRASKMLLRDVVATTRNSPMVEVRDLFERFIPENERVKRLGDAIDRSAILALRGDARRGREVFTTNPAAQCRSCHKLDGVGENVGPDLAKVGTKYSKTTLLEQILEPSKTIDPQYIAHVVETRDGRIFSGLILEKTDQSVVLKDAQGKTLHVPKAEIERLVPQSRSLMPELLLRDLTAQQVADLLEFLATMR
jgi:uncharacterized repeat protein (TIGR03806 family)